MPYSHSRALHDHPLVLGLQEAAPRPSEPEHEVADAELVLGEARRLQLVRRQDEVPILVSPEGRHGVGAPVEELPALTDAVVRLEAEFVVVGVEVFQGEVLKPYKLWPYSKRDPCA